MEGWRFYRHMAVYTDDGRRLGRVEEVGHAVDYLHVQQGVRLVRDWYVPMSAVREVNRDGVYLRVNRPELKRNGWNVPSEEYLSRQGATPGYEYTSGADVSSHSGPTRSAAK